MHCSWVLATKLRPHARDCVQAGVSVVPQHEYLSIRAAAIVPHLTPSLLRRHSRASRRASRRSLVVRASTWHGRRRVAAPRPASHANACALPGPRHSFARDGEDTSHGLWFRAVRAYCILDAELSDVILFAAPLSAPAAARAARAPPLLRSNTLNINFMALQIRSGRSVAEWAPSLKTATDACVLASNNASPAQRGPRRDAQPLHATPLASVLFPARRGQSWKPPQGGRAVPPARWRRRRPMPWRTMTSSAR